MTAKVGQKVVYPTHGVCQVEEVATQSFGDLEQEMVVLRVLSNNSKVMVPEQNLDLVGLRPLCTRAEIDALFEILEDGNIDTYKDWKGRYKQNLDKMKTGQLTEVAEVLKNLSLVSQKKSLSFREKKMYEKAKYFVVSEVAHVRDLDEVEAEQVVEAALGTSLDKRKKARDAEKAAEESEKAASAKASEKKSEEKAAPKEAAKKATGEKTTAKKKTTASEKKATKTTAAKGTSSTPKKASTKAAPAKTTAAKKTPAKKTPAKKTPAEKSASKATPAKKTTSKTPTSKTTPAEKTPAKKTPAKKTPAKTPTSKKASAKKTPPKSAPAKKTASKTAKKSSSGGESTGANA